MILRSKGLDHAFYNMKCFINKVLTLRCWKTEPSDRPKMSEVQEEFQNMYKELVPKTPSVGMGVGVG